MKLRFFLYARKNYFFLLVILIPLIGYFTVKFIFPDINLFSDFLLICIEKIINAFFRLRGSELHFQNHGIWHCGIHIEGFTTLIVYKRITLLYILILWLTRGSRNKKLIFTGFYIVLGLLSTVAYNIAGAIEIATKTTDTYILLNTYWIVFVCMNTCLLIWAQLNKKKWSKSQSDSSEYKNLLGRKLPDIIKLIYAYIVITFSISHFDYQIWINFLLRSSQIFLNLLGYESSVESNLLIGSNGSISLQKGCMGIITMFVFTAIIYLTGRKDKRCWMYVFLGIFVLATSNVIRFVLLFIHLQKHEDYVLTMDFHDLYNYTVYFIVFILWIIWFEKLFGAHPRWNLKLFSGKK